MHVALIFDEERLTHEHRMLNRLAVGLIGEGIQITRIVPQASGPAVPPTDEEEFDVALAARLEAPMKALPWTRRDRTTRLLDAMEKGPPDVLYAVGERAWSLGRDLAGALERPLAVEIWSAGQIRRAPRGRRARAVAGYVAPTQRMVEALRATVEPGLVCLVPMGVAIPPMPRRVLEEPEKSIALAIIGGGRDVPAYRALLGGLSRVVRKMGQIQAFLELAGPHEHEIWRHARRLELLESVSTITDAAQHRALITRCDLLLVPEQYGELHTLMLEAMATGMPVLASDDPYLDMLIDGRSASVIKGPDSEEWARHLERLLSDPETARTLGQGGRECVAAGCKSSDQVAKLAESLERIASGGTFPFKGIG